MNYLGIDYSVKNMPLLDNAFIPFGVWAEAYLKEGVPYLITLHGSLYPEALAHSSLIKKTALSLCLRQSCAAMRLQQQITATLKDLSKCFYGALAAGAFTCVAMTQLQSDYKRNTVREVSAILTSALCRMSTNAPSR